MPDMKQEMIKQVIRAYNESANYGNVPADLYDLDPSFWLDIASDKMCDLLEDCRQNAMQSGLDLLDCTIVPCAEATTYSTYHVLSTYMNPYRCIYGNTCYVSDVDSGSGPLQTHQAGGGTHAGSLYTTYAIVNKSYVDAFPVSHEVSARIQIGNQARTLGPFVGIDEINQRDSVYLGGRCGGGTGDERNCGTFSLTVYAEPATFET